MSVPNTPVTDETPRVWIGCLHCYNAGYLVGEWDAPSIKELKRKIDAVERALTHLKSLGLEPAALEDEAAPDGEAPRAPWFKRTKQNAE